ncbi:HNH endonuclease [Aestuariimicrobium sp. p3-SID1156]|uniref:HNH endonuclease n=1 Tax=Aestuariimicrobium sp. p3-SID1156 TaxID=2916038 RepID=UPI00223B7763|nr:HNH endonuclease [Aestuariimicrobium sp. p3-SID1156]MCT1459900.1 HNH endonuclease [Aestuariimicrobium sp. p3-SID1156]
MAVSKRTRFEVLRRDDHTCRYCGQMAPDVKITIDHVVPVPLGGTDAPDNLIAACYDCNVGKASTKPDDKVVQAVSDETLRFYELAKQAWAVRAAAIRERNAYIDGIGEQIHFPKPEGWRTSIANWYDLGIPEEVVLDAVRIATDKRDEWHNIDRFRYMAGVVWNQARETNYAIEEKFSLEGSWLDDSTLDEMLQEYYQQGHKLGREAGRREGYAHPTVYDVLLAHHVDGDSYSTLFQQVEEVRDRVLPQLRAKEPLPCG